VRLGEPDSEEDDDKLATARDILFSIYLVPKRSVNNVKYT